MSAPVLPVVKPSTSSSRNKLGALTFWLGMPLFLTLVGVATVLYLGSRELDDIEARVLNQPNVLARLQDHLELTAISTVIVILIAIPLGILVTRPFARRSIPVVLGVANLGQGIPSLGLITIIVISFGIGFWPVIIGLVAYSTLPILRNTMVGLQQVDRSLVKAARGMGMSEVAILTKVELPLAIPVMIAGIRTALILNVGTATLATFFGGGGLGQIVYQGIGLNRDPVLLVGVVLVSGLALLIDYLGSIAGRLLAPRGL